MLKRNVDYKVKGYTNRWSVIDIYKGYALLENNTWGDETCYLVVSTDTEVVQKTYHLRSTGEEITLPTITGTVYETFDGIDVALEDYDLD